MQKKNKEDSTVGWVATLDVYAAAMTLFSLSSKWEKKKKRENELKWLRSYFAITSCLLHCEIGHCEERDILCKYQWSSLELIMKVHRQLHNTCI